MWLDTDCYYRLGRDASLLRCTDIGTCKKGGRESCGSEVRTVQPEETASTKVLRQEHA